PVPMGLNPVTVSILLKNIIQGGIIGMDVMEVCPEQDIQNNTCHLASRLIGEMLSVHIIRKKVSNF
ncbi:MAG: arginase family protein, partial [Nitrosopumilus sp.]|nr:arginase family protein [Nitrosopumilus sp.]